jgi:hypothetical protein
MMPFHPTFRFLLRRYIPQVSNRDLDRHESLMALRLQLILERHMRPESQRSEYSRKEEHPPRDLRDQLIREATIEANGGREKGIFAGFEREFNAVQELWIARRQLALTSSPQFRSPSWNRLFRSLLHYYKVRARTFVVLNTNRLLFFRGRVVAILVLLLLVGLAVSQAVPTRTSEGSRVRATPESQQGPSVPVPSRR